MKILIILMLAFATFSAQARNKMGIGFMVGNPTGLNGKYWLNDKHAVDAGFGMSIGKHTDGNLHGDYLLHNKNAFYFNDVHALDLYYGIGARMEFADDIALGVRAPIGLAHELKDQPADIFGEIAPVVDFLGSVGLEISLAVGARYYF